MVDNTIVLYLTDRYRECVGVALVKWKRAKLECSLLRISGMFAFCCLPGCVLLGFETGLFVALFVAFRRVDL